MKISFIIPAYNEEKYITDCLAALLKETARMSPEVASEIFVVDNNSTDGTGKAAANFPGVTVLEEKKKGANWARTRGLQETTGDLVAYIDADTKMPEGWIATAVKEFKNNPALVSLTGPYIYYDMSSLGKVFIWLYWTIIATPAYWVTGYLAVGGNVIAKRDALLKIGGFDTKIAFYGDDTDLARRLAQVGKVGFSHSLHMYTSARRFYGDGILKSAWHYMLNFASIVLLHKPATKEYKDIR